METEIKKEKKVVLVVEDEVPLIKAIQIKLEKHGLSVVSARSLEQALRYLEDLEHVDAIWLDHYLLGEGDGLDFVVKLKNGNPKWSAIPIFVVSNTAGPDTMQSYVALGINKYYVKAAHRLDEIVEDLRIFLENPQ